MPVEMQLSFGTRHATALCLCAVAAACGSPSTFAVGVAGRSVGCAASGGTGVGVGLPVAGAVPSAPVGTGVFAIEGVVGIGVLAVPVVVIGVRVWPPQRPTPATSVASPNTAAAAPTYSSRFRPARRCAFDACRCRHRHGARDHGAG